MRDAVASAQLIDAVVALDELAQEMVFVGGAVTSLLLTDPASATVRETDDADAIVDRSDVVGYYAIEAALRAKGFTQKAGPENPVCRWFRGDVVLDVMPDDAGLLGFSNRWYKEAFANADEHEVAGRRIRVVSAVYFVATKLEAFAGRGKGDYQASHDLEDIVSLVDGREELGGEIARAPDVVRAYLREGVAALIDERAFVEALPGHLAGDDARLPIVTERLRRIAGR